MFRAVVLADGDELTVAEFPQIAAQVEGFDVRVPPAPPPLADVAPAPLERREGRIRAARSAHVMRLIDDSGDVRKIDDIEAEAIRFAFAHYRGQMSQMARKLGIGRSTLYRKMKELGIDAEVLGEAAA